MSMRDKPNPDNLGQTPGGGIREGLAELSPSPYLEDAVLDIAREEPWIDERRTSPWWPLVAVSAAAVVLFAFVFWTLRETVSGETVGMPDFRAAGEGAARVFTPPSPQQVADARAENAVPVVDGPHDPPWSIQKAWLPGGATAEFLQADLMPAIETAHHRWVFSDADAPPYPDLEQRVVSISRPSVMLAGHGFLRALGDPLIAGAGEQMVIYANDREWRPVAGTSELEVILASPEPGGAEARVRIVISTAYEGTLLVEEPIARALGLHQFEHPQRARLHGGLELIAQRALARLRIPELGIDTTLHAEVRPWRPWNVVETKRSHATKASAWIRVSGAIPVGVAHADEVSLSGEGGLSVMQAPNRQDAMTMGLAQMAENGRVEVSLVREGPTQLCFQYDEAPEQPAALLFLGSIDVKPAERWTYAYDVEWITLAHTDEPGARVIVARTWRGTTAIPSKEGVAVTRVGQDGRIRFPRVVGEAGGTLRMLVARAGSRSFHDVAVDASAIERVVIEVRPDSLRLGATTYTVSPDAESPDWKRFQSDLLQVTDAASGRDADGASSLAIEIRAAPEVPYRMFQAVLLVCAAPDIRVRRLSYGILGSPETAVESRLPTDEGLVADESAAREIEVVIEYREVGGVRFLMREIGSMKTIDTPLDPNPDASRALLEQGIRSLAEKGATDGLITVRGHDRVPYRAVHLAVRAFHDAGVHDVTFKLTERMTSPK